MEINFEICPNANRPNVATTRQPQQESPLHFPYYHNKYLQNNSHLWKYFYHTLAFYSYIEHLQIFIHHCSKSCTALLLSHSGTILLSSGPGKVRYLSRFPRRRKICLLNRFTCIITDGWKLLFSNLSVPEPSRFSKLCKRDQLRERI